MPYDVAIIGGGIVGLATARALQRRRPISVVVLEAESEIASHQTGHNSGVIHSGLYYRPGSLKARTCTGGREDMYTLCRERGIPHERCGKLVLATTAAEIERLRELERRGKANGLIGIQRLDPARLQEHEPHARGLEALWVPETGIVDYVRVAETLAGEVVERGGEIRRNARVLGVSRGAGHFRVRHRGGDALAKVVVGCAGLHADRIARRCGLRPRVRIVPFRGEYYRLVERATGLVRNLIYPVPDPRLPFLGVHFTRMIRGGVEAGPNAVLALRRDGYGRLAFSPRDALSVVGYSGFWRLSRRYWRTGIEELHRSWSKAAFVRGLRRLIPELGFDDVEPHGAGVRAQAVSADGTLLDDFHFVEAERMVHVVNAPSPAATASLAIGQAVADRAFAVGGL